MEREKKQLLQLLHPLVPLPVPLPEWSSINRDELGKTFVGYRQIPGSPLWPEKAAELPHRDVHHMVRQLSRFLDALHHIPVEAGVEIGLPTPDIHAYWSNMYDRINEKLFPSMGHHSRHKVRALFEELLNELQNKSISLSIIHGDFGPSNILYVEAG